MEGTIRTVRTPTTDGRERVEILLTFAIVPRITDGQAEKVMFRANQIPTLFRSELTDREVEAIAAGDLGWCETELPLRGGEDWATFKASIMRDFEVVVSGAIQKARDEAAEAGDYAKNRDTFAYVAPSQ